MKILTVVGARPQFIKAAAVSRILRQSHKEILIHTGQHYDANMSAVFFDELGIPRPDYNLGVGSGPHGRQTAQMLEKAEEVLLTEKPDIVIVYGDTNSTLAGALAASKLLVPVAHVEAGLRSYNMQMPEEQNRVLTDHISSLLFCPTSRAVENLGAEGIAKNVFNVGDVMCDALLHYKASAAEKYGETGTGELKHMLPRPSAIDRWYLATIHRAENTDGTLRLENILEALRQLGAPVVFPVHPRIKRPVEELSRSHDYASIHFVEPVGYLQMIRLISGAKGVITDSGGLQKEAYLLGVPCVTVREQTEWVETLAGGWNSLAKPEASDILEKVLQGPPLWETRGDYYGDGHAAEKICGIIGGAV